MTSFVWSSKAIKSKGICVSNWSLESLFLFAERNNLVKIGAVEETRIGRGIGLETEVMIIIIMIEEDFREEIETGKLLFYHCLSSVVYIALV